MCIQSRVSANCRSHVPLWHQFKVIALLAERITIQMQYATRFSAGLTVFRRSIQKMQIWCEHMRPRWSALERLRLIASVPREGTTNISDLIMLMPASLTLIRCMARGSLQGVTMLCQK